MTKYLRLTIEVIDREDAREEWRLAKHGQLWLIGEHTARDIANDVAFIARNTAEDLAEEYS